MSRSEELRVSAGKVNLAGTLTLPDEPALPDRRGRYPNVLLLPSWLPRNRNGTYDRASHPTWFSPAPLPPGLLARLAEALAGHGVASLRCDARGSGDSEGSWEQADLFTRIDDARDMLGAMRGHGALDLRRTGIVGHGEGAGVALAVAIGDPAVSALTLIGAAARSWRDVLRRAVAARGRDGGDRRHPIVAAIDRWSEDLIERAERREGSFELYLGRGERVTMALAGIEQAINTPPLALATMLHRSVGLVHGTDDLWVDPDESRLLAAAFGGEGAVQPRLVSNAGHDLDEASDELIDELAADLAARLVPRELPPVLVAIDEMER
ncbi:MAG: alpha/beta hydrolase [Chloroflexi bacterium]|nr:MAG: alpha/beta hydrolase [Chloroflexota bacterium]